MLCVKEAADRLKVHPGTIYRWIWAGQIQHVRYGKVHEAGSRGRGGAIRIPEWEIANREAQARRPDHAAA